MGEAFNLKYGGQDRTFQKSDDLLAIKPRPGMEKRLDAAFATVAKEVNAGVPSLGGFKVVRVNTASPERTDDLLNAMRNDPAVATGSHVFHTSTDGVPFVPTGTIFVEFDEAASPSEQEALLASSNLQIVEARGSNTYLAKVTPQARNPVRVAADLQKSSLVKIAEPEFATEGQLKAFGLPTDLLLSEQWHLENKGEHRGTTTGFKAGADARVVEAWRKAETVGAPTVVIAVIDDGFDLAHSDLNGPGKIIHPWDFTRNSNNPGPDSSTSDWHGTACAGVATGRSGGGSIVGAAPGCALMPVRWGVNLSDSQIEAWFSYVTTRGAWVVSCSWGALASYFPLSTRAQRAIAKCAREGRGGRGCVVVFAAGNSNHDINRPPATLDGFAVHPDVITVAASTSKDTRSDYSNFGKEIWICAPSSGAGGWGILTSDVTGELTLGAGHVVPLGYASGDYTYDFGGTSSACPLVAGICALVLTANPDLTAAEVRAIIRDSARKIGDPADYNNGHSRNFGYGCVDAEHAIRIAAAMKDGDAAQVAAA